MKNAVMKVDLTTYKETYDRAMSPLLEEALIKLGAVSTWRSSLFSIKEFIFEHSVENFNVYPDYIDLGMNDAASAFINDTIVNVAEYLNEELEQLTPDDFVLDETYINVLQPLCMAMVDIFNNVFVAMSNHVLNCIRSLYNLISNELSNNHVTQLRNLDVRVYNAVDYTITIECMFFK